MSRVPKYVKRDDERGWSCGKNTMGKKKVVLIKLPIR